MKKILAIALVLLFVVALAVPAFAVDSPGGPGSGGGGNTPGGANAPSGKSPQTGYNMVVWGVAAAAMAVCAGYCFSKSGKKVAC